jgi:uncharacterized C2H2 Zn-finger protein
MSTHAGRNYNGTYIKVKEAIERKRSASRGNAVKHYCPRCPASFTTDELYKEHYREAHAKRIGY